MSLKDIINLKLKDKISLDGANISDDARAKLHQIQTSAAESIGEPVEEILNQRVTPLAEEIVQLRADVDELRVQLLNLAARGTDVDPDDSTPGGGTTPEPPIKWPPDDGSSNWNFWFNELYRKKYEAGLARASQLQNIMIIYPTTENMQSIGAVAARQIIEEEFNKIENPNDLFDGLVNKVLDNVKLINESKTTINKLKDQAQSVFSALGSSNNYTYHVVLATEWAIKFVSHTAGT